MNKIIVYIGDSYAVSSITDYEWLVKKNLIDEKIINYFDFIKYCFLYKKNNSLFSIAQKVKKENCWTNRLAKKLNIEHSNLAMMGSSWQSMLNQALYAILNIKNKEIIFMISCTVNERILIDKIAHLLVQDVSLLDYYEDEEIKQKKEADYLLNNYSHQIKNKINLSVNFLFKKEELEILDTLFTKKIFTIYNLQAVIGILNLIKDYQFFFLPTWYETVRDQMEEITKNKNILETFVLSKIPKEQLDFKSPFTLKDFKSNPYTVHPSFDSQELIAEHYYDFLKNKIK